MLKQFPESSWNRREWLAAVTAAGLAGKARAASAPSSPVAVARCQAYDASVLPAMRKMFDQIGGIGKLVSGKTVAVKICMTNPVRGRTGFRPAWYTRWSHPAVIQAAVQLIGQAGASRVRIVEGSYEDDHPLEENILIGGWDPDGLFKAAPKVEMENTDSLGYAKAYSRLKVADGGRVYPAFDFNHSYAECDVFVSIAKMKEHEDAGIALTMENLVSSTPASVYGDAAGPDEPAARPYGPRTMFRTGYRQPPLTAPAERDPKSSRESGYRFPRVMVDILQARPVHLAIIDGIETQTGASGVEPEPKSKRQIKLVKPGMLVAGLNPVCTDAVAAAAMGFDPMAERGTAPFENCDSVLRLAEEAGIGARDLARIEVVGAAIREVRFPFRQQR